MAKLLLDSAKNQLWELSQTGPTTPTVVEASHFATLQIHEGPKIFCDASVDSQNLVAGNQTGIGVLIITQPARSISHASFFQVAIKQVLEPLEVEAHALLFCAKLAAALDLQDTALLTDNQVVASAVLARSPLSHPGH